MKLASRVTRRAMRHAGSAVVLAATMGAGSAAFAAGTAQATSTLSSDMMHRLTYAPAIGQESTFRVSAQGVGMVEMERLAALMSPSKGTEGLENFTSTTHRFDVTATLGMRVVGREGDQWLVSMRLADAQYVIDGRSDTVMRAVDAPFLVRMSSKGEFLSFEFPFRLPQAAQLAIRALVEPMQVVFGEEGASVWNTQENNTHGVSNVTYRVLEQDRAAGVARLSRTVTSAQRALMGADSSASLRRFETNVDLSEGTIEWALDGSGVRAISLHEKTRSKVGKDALSASDLRFEARPQAGRVAGLPANAQALRAALRSDEYARASYYGADPSFKAAVINLDFATALSNFQTLLPQAPAQAARLMGHYLREFPEQSMPFARAINEWSLGTHSPELETLVGHGFGVIGYAGHTEAQRALADVLEGNGFSPLSQLKALEALISVELPERFLPAVVWAYRERLPETSDVDDAQIRISEATNIYGMLGDVRSGVEGNTKEVIQTLTTLLNSGDAKEQRRGLLALGNIGNPELTLPLVERFFRSRDATLRAAAYESFTDASSDALIARFVAEYAKEKDANVHLEASGVATKMAHSPKLHAWAAEQAVRGANPIIQSRGVHILGASLTEFPGNKQMLQDLLTHVKDRDLRKIIYSYTLGRTGGAK